MNAQVLYDFTSRQPYYYQAEINFADAAAIGSQLTDSVRITDTPFVCTQIIVISRIDDFGTWLNGDDQDGSADQAGGWPDPGVRIQLQETGTDRFMAQTAIDGLVWGALRNRPLPVPKLFRASSTVTVTATLMRLLASGTGLDVRVVFEGYQQFA